MKIASRFKLAFAVALTFAASANAADESLRNEVQRAIDRGTAWLLANQNSNGWWSTGDHTAVSALALTALNGDPSGRAAKEHA
ncbi:MAG: hypothetical protein HY300_08190, partial [Verrucomicrobia bacterium]|nr:hypothetical protein [Verrucomicrobiota bacterium]